MAEKLNFKVSTILFVLLSTVEATPQLLIMIEGSSLWVRFVAAQPSGFIGEIR